MLYVTTKPAAKSAATLCYHCGDPAGDNPVSKADKAFCCSGCLTVYEILAENNLCRYYELENHPGRKLPRDKQVKVNFNFLDDEEQARRVVQFTDGKVGVARFTVPAIHCSSCIWLLENLHKLCGGIQQVEVNFPRREVTIRFDWKQLGLKGVVEALHKIGYPPLLQWDAVNRGIDADAAARKRLLGQLGVAGFCLGNIMLLSFPEYLQPGGVALAFRQLFAYTSLLLSFPLLFFAAYDYLLGAWNGIKGRFFTIDQPLALGMLTMFFRSCYEILSGEGAGYLDSLSGLIFFLLVGKFLQQLTFRHLVFDRDYRAYFPMAVTILSNEPSGNQIEKNVPINQVKVGSKLIVKQGEVVPTDSILHSVNAAIDYSFITGESKPVTVIRGELVYAGGRQLGGRAEYIAQKAATHSTLTQLWNHPAFKKKEAAYTQLVNQLSKYFTAFAIAIAVGSFVYWQATDVARAWHAFTAVLIIACPCALAFAAPFAYGHITRVLGRHSFFLKNALVVEKLAALDTLVFDKTGTLTGTGNRALDLGISLNFARPLTATELAKVSTLAAQSAHPISRTLANALPGSHLNVLHFQEELGRGVSATIEGQTIRLGSAAYCEASAPDAIVPSGQSLTVHLNIDGAYRGCFKLPQIYREGMAEMLQKLRLMGYKLSLLSGDKNHHGSELTGCFASAEMHYEHSPASKLTFMESMQHQGYTAAMVGDGLNDAGALQAAHVGIAVNNEAGLFTPASDAIIGADSLNRLPKFLRLARLGKAVVWVCFAVSLIYNVTGVWFAVQGLLSPVIAAILMPFSSIGTIALASGMAYIAAWAAGLTLDPEKDDLNQFLA